MHYIPSDGLFAAVETQSLFDFASGAKHVFPGVLHDAGVLFSRRFTWPAPSAPLVLQRLFTQPPGPPPQNGPVIAPDVSRDGSCALARQHMLHYLFSLILR